MQHSVALVLRRFSGRFGEAVVVAPPKRLTTRNRFEIDASPAAGTIENRQIRESLEQRIPKSEMAFDEPHLLDSPTIRLGSRFQIRIGVDIEILLVPVDIVIVDQTGDDIDRPAERFGSAEIQEQRLPITDLTVGVSAQKILGMFERDRSAVQGAARLDPDKELHPRRMRRVTDRLERSVVPIRIRPPVAGHDPPIPFENRIGRDDPRSVPTRVEPINVQRNLICLDLLDDVEMFFRRNATPDDSGNRRLDQFPIAMRRVMVEHKPSEHVLTVHQLPLPVKGQVHRRADRLAGMKDRVEVFDSGQNRRVPAPLMIEIGSPAPLQPSPVMSPSPPV